MRSLELLRRRRGEAAPAPVTCVLGDLAIGGVPRVYAELLGVLASGGAPVRVIAPDGPMRPRFEERGIEWQPVDWTAARADSFERVRALLAAGGVAIATADPAIVHVLPALAAAGPAALVLHGTAPRLPAWFGDAGVARLVRLVSGLAGASRLAVMTIGETYAREYAALLGVPEARIAVLVPAVDCGAIPFAAAPAPIRSVLSLCRLSPEKAAHVEAGVALVRARLAAGEPCVLDVVGDGPWRAEAEALCARELPPGAWRLHGATDAPVAAMREAGVVLATGVTALEAAAAGARVAIVRTTTDDAGPLGPMLTAARYPELAADSFGARGRAPAAPEEVWSELDALDPGELAAIRRLVEDRNSTGVAVASLHGALGGLGEVEPEPAIAAAGAHAAGILDELGGLQRTADEIWAVRVRLQAELDALRAEG